ncbi:MAG TPA: hypothetical protein VN781_02825 [Acidimicrobiales bacterium]|nr:hypothetical protein [Acidimicrobiales bacterium]
MSPDQPLGLHPLGQLDGRFAVSHETTVPTSLALVARYFTALAARDVAGMAEVLHFPFASYEGIEPVLVESPEQFVDTPPRSMNVTVVGPNHVRKGSYDILDGIELQVYNAVGAGVSMTYSRYGPDGHRLLRCEGIYAVTNNDGRWGIELLSTIFTPAGSIGVRYPDAEIAALRRGHDWMLGYSRRDQAILNGTHQVGRRANVSLSNPRANAANARAGDPMAGYPIEGVKSRLRVTEATPESIAAGDANFPQFAEWAGGGVGQWDYTVNLPEARVLHATIDKVHTFGGYVRYTTDSRPVSETHALGILTYKEGRWGSSGGIGVVMHHDYTNDLPTE